MYNKPLNQATTAQIFLFHFAAVVSELHADGLDMRISNEELDGLFRDKFI